MCNPMLAVAAVSVIASATASAISIVQAQNQAEAETKSAESAAASDYQRATLQQEQINASAGLDMTERLRQSLKERAAIRLSAAEAGLTTGREELAAHQAASKDISIMEANRSAGIEQSQAEKDAIFANAQGRIRAAASRVPSPFMAGLQIATSTAAAGAQGYAAGRSIAGPAPKT
ncbi:hypothetical protein [Geobacter sp. SVR]|uniref:virion core protein, T7 gp14 family n=1 Tax=Geobacter sp. SVR TaxID=2495594 RepID=UPI00143F0151|nr:hypothetical protein [Geobacter sp. SVR]BCS53305.1 hypothetical protein GSVR_16130 [Geobacter sp. SVR]GCF85569.1 hypothetical protein GSbR_21690 [Geobacter sp. SVR]